MFRHWFVGIVFLGVIVAGCGMPFQKNSGTAPETAPKTASWQQTVGQAATATPSARIPIQRIDSQLKALANAPEFLASVVAPPCDPPRDNSDQSKANYQVCLAAAKLVQEDARRSMGQIVASNPDVIVCWLVLPPGTYFSVTHSEPREHASIPVSSIIGRMGRPLPEATLTLSGGTEEMLPGDEVVPDHLAVWKLADGHVMLTRALYDAADREQVGVVGVVLASYDQVDANQINFVLP